jgi:hypothetical protein
MKNLIKLFSLALTAGLFLTSCEGPMGLPGKDANESCLICHTTANMDTKDAQFELSDKGERGARSGKYCARCHTTEGFQEIVKMGTFVASNEMLNGTKLGCSTCHKHSSFDFAGDTVSQILRTIAPVYSNWNNYNYTSNAYARTTATDYKGINNLCANCHQFRGSTVNTYTDSLAIGITPVTTPAKFSNVPYFPVVNTGSNENTTIKLRAGTSFGIHEGAIQPDFLTSKNGYEYSGKTYTKTTAHSGFKCIDCHFNEYNPADSTGGHTMRVNTNDPKCTTCHNIATKRTTTLAAVNAKLTELGDLLAARKVFKKNATSGAYSVIPSHDFRGTLIPNSVTPTTTKYAMSLSSSTYASATGFLTYNSRVLWAADVTSTGTTIGSADRIGREWKYGELGAAYNWTYVNTVADANNKAVHNPTYAMELLQSSIDWLKANP